MLAVGCSAVFRRIAVVAFSSFNLFSILFVKNFGIFPGQQ
jgi:hypothetical protein